MKCIMLGTGHALVTRCFNTCFVLEENNSYFLVDTGGGNQILSQLEKANVDISRIEAIFISHKHTDHILGIFWLIRTLNMYKKMGRLKNPVTLYSHFECIECIQNITKELFNHTFEDIIQYEVIQDLDKRVVLNHSIQFFDTYAKKEKQFGFQYQYDDIHIFSFCGDEPCIREELMEKATYLMHEAFCLHAQKDIFHPERAHHSTVLQACQIAQKYHIPNVILFHTEDYDLTHRKENYIKEGQSIYTGNLFVPNDLEEIELCK
ncbi:MAG: MBL fold metallo-hydrolase [Bacillota bacterium]|nr:MBL fold metallo-hydrolase [Bacillota bacterium]